MTDNGWECVWLLFVNTDVDMIGQHHHHHHLPSPAVSVASLTLAQCFTFMGEVLKKMERKLEVSRVLYCWCVYCGHMDMSAYVLLISTPGCVLYFHLVDYFILHVIRWH